MSKTRFGTQILWLLYLKTDFHKPPLFLFLSEGGGVVVTEDGTE
jgi:hypothetical protein